MADFDQDFRKALTEYVEAPRLGEPDLASVLRKRRRLVVQRRLELVFVCAALVGCVWLAAIQEGGLFSGPTRIAGRPQMLGLEGFDPPLQIDVGPWTVMRHGDDFASLALGGLRVTLVQPDGVFGDVAAATALDDSPIPANLHGFLLAHDGIESISDAGIAARLGPFPASYIDLRLRTSAGDVCSPSCLPLLVVGGERVDLVFGRVYRVVIANAEGHQLVAVIEGRPKGFARSVTPANELLDRVVLKDALAPEPTD